MIEDSDSPLIFYKHIKRNSFFLKENNVNMLKQGKGHS